VLGGIGIGGRGTYVLKFMLEEPDVQFVSICDLRKSRREACKNLVDEKYGNKDCTMYRDLREFLAERTDIDAILTATGDRWHAMAATLAMRAGKDVYSEKPSCMTIAEGQKVVETAERYGRVYQTGTQRLSEAHFTFANELLRLGRLGEIHTVRAHLAPWNKVAEMDFSWLEAEPQPPKEEVDWDIWLGPCPWRPYNKKYIDGNWRGYYDFHTSNIGEWGAHTIAQCQVAIGAAETSPVKYNYLDDPTADGMVVEYENGIKMVLELDAGNKIWHGSCGVRYEGTEGWVSIADAYEMPEVSSPAMLGDYDKLVDDYQARTQHPVMMHRSMTAVHAANICMWLKRDMKYDPVKEEFIGDDEANRMRSRAQREPWIV
jgi:hypothetical protein